MLKLYMGGANMEYVWNFLFYSFVGFGLEVIYAHLTGGRRDRKRTLLLPLCPVYGVGAAGILLLAPLARGNQGVLFFLGGMTATVVEYILAFWYEKGLGVSFWDYTGVRGNLHGRVCLPFSLAWGCLSLVLVHWVHPAVQSWQNLHGSGVITAAASAMAAADLVVSGIMLRLSGNRDCLRWYDRSCMKWPREEKT